MTKENSKIFSDKQKLEDIRKVYEELFEMPKWSMDHSPTAISDTLADLNEIGFLKLSQIIPVSKWDSPKLPEVNHFPKAEIHDVAGPNWDH